MLVSTTYRIECHTTTFTLAKTKQLIAQLQVFFGGGLKKINPLLFQTCSPSYNEIGHGMESIPFHFPSPPSFKGTVHDRF